MAYNQGGDLWEGLEPRQPEPGDGGGPDRTVLIGILSGVFVLLVIGACAIGGYLWWANGSGGDGGTENALDVPTATQAVVTEPAGEATSAVATPTAAVATPTIAGAATSAIAPTVTLAATAEVEITGVGVDQLATVPIIDGSIAEWSTTGTVTSQFQVFNAASWDGSDDLVAVWRLGWTEDALFLAVDVTDDVHVQTQSGNQIFRGDSVDLQIDTNPAAGALRVNPQTFQIILSPGDFGAQPPVYFRFQGTAGGSVVDAQVTTISVAAVPTATGYTLEAAIPWAALNVTPRSGLVLGIALNANDNDTPNSATQEVMKSHVGTRTLLDPSTWGALTLR